MLTGAMERSRVADEDLSCLHNEEKFFEFIDAPIPDIHQDRI
jgi:hypothetical protein